MSRRASLPGADELFRSTVPATAAPPAPVAASLAEPVPSEPPPDLAPAEPAAGRDLAAVPAMDDIGDVPPPPPTAVRRRPRSTGERRPTGRERHDEKITVYCSAEELIDLERARLTLRGEHGLAVDRGRIVREALVVVLNDLETKGEQSVLVRRLRGR